MRKRKAVGGRAKLYAWHAPEVACISKGKAKQTCEFGVKVGTMILSPHSQQEATVTKTTRTQMTAAVETETP